MSKTSLGQFNRLYTLLFSAVGVGLIVFILAIAAFIEIASEVGNGNTLNFDEQVLLAINQTASGWQDIFWTVITQFGGFTAALLVGAILAIWLYRRGKKRQSIGVVFGVGGAILLNRGLKLYFERDRPELWDQIIVETSYSFPSGHSMASTSLALVVILLLWNTRWRIWSIVGGLIYMALIGYSRLYLGVHYPSDVLGGWVVSLAWVLLIAGLLTYFKRRPISRDKPEGEGS